MQFLAFERRVEHRVRELEGILSQLSLESRSQNDKLVEVCHNINDLKEALTEQFGTASHQSLYRLDQNEAEMKALVAQQTRIEQRVCELDAKLAQLSCESGSLSDKLIEISHDNNNLKQAITEQFGSAFDRCIAEIKALFSEKVESLRSALTSELASVRNVPRTHQWVLKGYAALKEEALKKGWSLSMSDKVYLQRYLMSWGIDVRKEGDSLNLALCIRLHEGSEDEFLHWPFIKTLQLSIIHPETRRERRCVGEPDSAEYCRDCFGRPIGGSNRPARFSETMIELGDIESDGYVKKDELLLRLEVLL
ncbi:hypothetical protein HPB48_015260 [Haemaphysalis longicornis]|uniref:TRAF1-6 MATH domain-containing protein n=1 Tax=Haemaphysalis longicornis TaxID=44386 RepID=A0A9J6FSU6_HAELO|nr:hypothetical protein HPB48_015260 [Haemaphysalis longicornis]